MQLFQSSGLQVLHSFLNDSRQHFHWRSSSFPDVLDHLRTTAFAGQVAWGYFFPEGMEVFKTAFPKAHLHANRTVSASRSCPFTKAFALHIDSSEEEVCVDDHCLLERWEDGVCCRELNNCCCRSEGKVIYLLLWRWRGEKTGCCCGDEEKANYCYSERKAGCCCEGGGAKLKLDGWCLTGNMVDWIVTQKVDGQLVLHQNKVDWWTSCVGCLSFPLKKLLSSESSTYALPDGDSSGEPCGVGNGCWWYANRMSISASKWCEMVS